MQNNRDKDNNECIPIKSVKKQNENIILWEKIKNKLIHNNPLEVSENDFIIENVNTNKQIKDDLEKIDIYICDGCRSLKRTSELARVKNKEVSHFLCKECRKKFGLETEQDVINDLKGLIKTAPEIVKYLDKYIIGQEPVKKAVSVEVRNHFLKAINKEVLLEKDIEISKNNILLTGPSGTGKTLLIKTLSKLLDIPFAIVDATNYTSSGYAGEDVQSILAKLLANANYNIYKAEHGIVYIDEVDKIAKNNTNSANQKDVSGECVQQALLKMVEGGKVNIPINGGRVNPNQKLFEMDTTNILFICGGAFDGIEDIVKERLNIKENKGNPIGFNAVYEKDSNINKDKKSIRKNISTQDLKKFGLIDEFLGRFSITCNLLPLDEEQLINILKSKNGVIQQYKTIFELEDKKLKFDNDSLSTIANLALRKEIGARGLSNIVSTYMSDILYNISLVKKKCYTVKAIDIIDYYNEENNNEILNII